MPAELHGALARGRRPRLGLFSIVCSLVTACVAGHARAETAEQALEQLRTSGVLHNTTVRPTFALDSLTDADGPFVLSDVNFEGPVVLSRRLRGSIRFERVTFSDVVFEGARFSSKAEFEGCRFEGAVRIVDAVFEQPARFDGSAFADGLALARTRFDRGVSFLGVTWSGERDDAPPLLADLKLDARANFSSALFAGVARFDRSMFAVRADFNGAEFQSDVTFANTQFGEVDFSGAVFRGDAQFGRSRFGDILDAESSSRAFQEPCPVRERPENPPRRPTLRQSRDRRWTADFSGRWPAVFLGGADFRHSTFCGDVRYDEVDFRGGARFSMARFAGALGLARATVDAPGLVFDVRESPTRLQLEGATLTHVQWSWPVVRTALVNADMSAQQLGRIHRQLSEQKDDSALPVYALWNAKRVDEALATGRAAARATALFEHVAWGWPTRYFTDLPRTLLLALLAWLAFAVPLIGARHSHLIAERESAHLPSPCTPLSPSQVSGMPRGVSFTLALELMFATMFLWPKTGVRVVTRRPAWWARYLRLSRAVGTWLLALITVTIVRALPVLDELLKVIL